MLFLGSGRIVALAHLAGKAPPRVAHERTDEVEQQVLVSGTE